MIPFFDYFNSVFASKGKWYKKYAVFLLCFLFVFIHSVAAIVKEDLKPKNGGIIHIAGLYLFIATGIYILMQSGDKLEQAKQLRIKIPLVILISCFFIVWLFCSLLWIMHVYGF